MQDGRILPLSLGISQSGGEANLQTDTFSTLLGFSPSFSPQTFKTVFLNHPQNEIFISRV